MGMTTQELEDAMLDLTGLEMSRDDDNNCYWPSLGATLVVVTQPELFFDIKMALACATTVLLENEIKHEPLDEYETIIHFTGGFKVSAGWRGKLKTALDELLNLYPGKPEKVKAQDGKRQVWLPVPESVEERTLISLILAGQVWDRQTGWTASSLQFGLNVSMKKCEGLWK